MFLFLVMFFQIFSSPSDENYNVFCANHRAKSEMGDVYKLSFEHNNGFFTNGYFSTYLEIQAYNTRNFYRYHYIAVKNDKTKNYDLLVYSEKNLGEGYKNTATAISYLINENAKQKKINDRTMSGIINKEGICSLSTPEKGAISCHKDVNFMSDLKRFFVNDIFNKKMMKNENIFSHTHSTCVLVDNRSIEYQGLYEDGLNYLAGNSSTIMLVQKDFDLALNLAVLLEEFRASY